MHILLIVDHLKCREQMAVILQRHFPGIASLRTARSFAEAVEAIGADHPLDLGMTDTQSMRATAQMYCALIYSSLHTVC
jgi:DNA-binding NarL/FixJ family response regulator